ncbi:MAG: 3'-5' exonuclease [Planctomycetia bacterium]|nr:3'-5' exonuclease [Planctomycetia bacterium]
MSTTPSSDVIRYLIFDIESVADPALVSLVRTGGEVPPNEALRAYRDELMEKRGSDFVPYVYHVPVSVVLAKVSEDFTLVDLTALKIDDGGPRKLCERFWEGWRYYDYPRFVTFNGRGFDLPLMELTAFRFGIPIPEWFMEGAPSFKQPRNRYAAYHIDLYDALTNYGATQFIGGLNLASKLLHKPGKFDAHGDMVQDLYDAGEFDAIHRYCRCDVIDTYFVFLRHKLLRGLITVDQEKELVENARQFLKSRAQVETVYQEYLDAWDRYDAYLSSNDAFERFVKPGKSS